MKATIIGLPRWLWRLTVVCTFYTLIVWIDRETASFSDMFKPSNLFALLLYIAPTYGICVLLDWWFSSAHRSGFFFSLLLGIPTGFLIMALVLGIAMGRI